MVQLDMNKLNTEQSGEDVTGDKDGQRSIQDVQQQKANNPAVNVDDQADSKNEHLDKEL